MTVFDTGKLKSLTSVGGLHLRVFDNLEAVKHIWLGLEVNGISTIFQSYAWCSTWFMRLGNTQNLKPCILLAEDEFGRVAFLLPLQLRRSKGLSIIETFTAPQAGYSFALFDPYFLDNKAANWFAEHFEQLTNALPDHDVFQLHDLPETAFGRENPLLQTRSFLAANQSHVLKLQSDYQALYERRRSFDSRRSIRKRDVKLEALPGLSFNVPHNSEDRKETMRVMFIQQEARLAEAGIHNVFEAEERAFYTDLLEARTPQGFLFRPYRLCLNGEVQAVIFGVEQNRSFLAMISSMAGGELQRFSPGDYILRRMIKSLCEEGMETLDFSSGDSAYKFHWSDQQVPLHFIVRGNTLKGVLLALFLLAREKIKRLGKRTPYLNSFLFTARKFLTGKRT